MEIHIPTGARKIIARLEQHGYEAYIVGGCVRDSLMGKRPSDWDICTSARAEEMMALFEDKRVIPTGIQHGTLTILAEDGAYEVTTFRIDGEYLDHRHPKSVAFTRELAEDLSRRDFTINAMAWHPERGLIDLFGGVEDLRDRLVRAVGDPVQRFNEDGLRMLRMVRFATVLDFDYDPATYDAVRKQGHLLQYISKERIQVELNKILLAAHPARGLEDLYTLGMYPYIIPMMCHTVGFAQRGGHHFLDVFEHSLLAVGVIAPELVLRLTMLLHDIGKPFVWDSSESLSYDRFDDHAAVSAKLAGKILRDLKYDNATRKDVVELIAHHNDILLPDPVNVRRALARLGEVQTRRLVQVKVADLIAHDLAGEREKILALFAEISDVIDEVVARGDCTSVKALAIGGQDMMALGLSGRAIGQMLNAALEIVLEKPEMNTRETLLNWVRGNLENCQK
ncbi:MAG: HD domain-containing protein [Peptococcaceae bacterium]|nr:HD domain-containing protein [Peptococcaceae bacterium]